jgi:hypothetical protein
MRRSSIFQMMPFVDDEPIVRGNHRGVSPVFLRATHSNIRHQQMMIDDYDIGVRRRFAREKRKQR